MPYLTFTVTKDRAVSVSLDTSVKSRLGNGNIKIYFSNLTTYVTTSLSEMEGAFNNCTLNKMPSENKINAEFSLSAWGGVSFTVVVDLGTMAATYTSTTLGVSATFNLIKN